MNSTQTPPQHPNPLLLIDSKVVPLQTTLDTLLHFQQHKGKGTLFKGFGRKVIQPEIWHFKYTGMSSLQSKVLKHSHYFKAPWVVTLFESGQVLVFDSKTQGTFYSSPLEKEQKITYSAHSYPWLITVHQGEKAQTLRVVMVREAWNVMVVKKYSWNGSGIVGITQSGFNFSVVCLEGLHSFHFEVNDEEHFKVVETGSIQSFTTGKIKSSLKQYGKLLVRVSKDTVELYDMKQKSLVHCVQSRDNSYFLHSYLQEDVLLCATSNTLYFVSLEAKGVKSEIIIPLKSPISYFKVFNDQLLTGSFDGIVRLYDLKSEGTHLYDINTGEQMDPLATISMITSLAFVDEYVFLSTTSGRCEIYSLHMKYQKQPLAAFDLCGDYIVEIQKDEEQVHFITHNKQAAIDGYFTWSPNLEKLDRYMNEAILSQFILRPKPGKKGVFYEWRSNNYLNEASNDKFIKMIQLLAEKEYPFLMSWHHSCTITNNTLENNPIVFVTDSFTSMTGYTREEIYGQNCKFLQGKFTDSETVRKISEHLKEGKGLSVQILNYRKDGKPFWNVFMILPVHDSKGKVPAFIAIQKDITKIKLSQPLSEWLPVHVSLWLENIGRGIYSHLFIQNKIGGKELENITKEKLISIGTSKADANFISEQIQLLLHKNKMLRTYKNLSNIEGLTRNPSKKKETPSSRSAD